MCLHLQIILKMRLIHFSSHQIGIISLSHLIEKGCLAGIVIPNRENSHTAQIEILAAHQKIPLLRVEEKKLSESLDPFIRELDAVAALVATFPYRIPANTLTIPEHGFWNIHHAPLPQFRGRETTFWQLATRQKKGGLTLHKMDAGFDTGPILYQADTQIVSGDTYGTHLNRAAQLAPPAVDRLLKSLATETFQLEKQNEVDAQTYFEASPEDLLINWQRQSAEEIEALCQAANPNYGGAITYFRGIEVGLMEAEAIKLNSPTEISPGTIALIPEEAHIYVMCKDQWCIRLHVISIVDGVFSGVRFRSLFDVKNGERFTQRNE